MLAIRMLAMYLLRLYNGEPQYETIGRIGTPGSCIFGWPENVGTDESVGSRWLYKLLLMNSLSFISINCFNVLALILVVGSLLSNWYE